MTGRPIPLRLGLVGCGRLAEVGYLPAVARTPAVEIAGVVDPDPTRRSVLAAQCGGDTTSHGGLDDLLATSGLDGVVLASPATAHVPDAARVVAAGLPVLVEKPPAPDAAGARHLVELGPSVRVGFNRRYDDGARSLRAAVANAHPVDLDLSIQYRRASWRPHSVRDDVLADLGPHLVDWARWLTGGAAEEVTTVDLSTDRAELDLRLDTGRARLTAAADRFHAERLVARDRAGTRIARHRVGGPVAAVTGRFPRRGRPHPLVASLAAQLHDFAAAIRGGEPPDLGTAADGHAVMAVIDAARASALAGGRATPVADPVEQTPC